jgi:hypothetical protein
VIGSLEEKGDLLAVSAASPRFDRGPVTAGSRSNNNRRPRPNLKM